MRDTLYLLPPGFEANGRREYCPECAEMWGLLHSYPAILQSLEIVYQPIDHPRPALVARLGPGAWNCPPLQSLRTAPAISIARDQSGATTRNASASPCRAAARKESRA